MDSKSDYFENTPEILKKALKVNGKTEKDLKQDIRILKDWFKVQPHLPEVPDDQIVAAFLILNKFSIENTKKRLDMYYTMRSLFPEFFKNKHPLSPHMLDAMENTYFIPLPKSTVEGYRVVFFHLANDSLEGFNIYNFLGHTYNVAELRLQEDYPFGDIIVYDFKNVKLAHLGQLTPTVLKNMSRILEGTFNNKIKQIHILNYPSYAETVILLAKKFVNPKISKRFHFHKEAKTIKDFLSIKILPKDYGGEELSLKDLNDIWKRKFSDYKTRFDALEKFIVEEKLRPASANNDERLGFHGNFKKLNVD